MISVNKTCGNAGVACLLVGLTLVLTANSGSWSSGAKAPRPSGLPRTSRPAKELTTAAYTWRNVTITAGGFVDGLLFSPVQKSLIYARTDIGGAYRWDARAARWIPLNDQEGGKDANLLGCESLGVDPVDAHRVYMAAGTYTQSWAGNGAILRSKDQGRTWQRTDMPFKMGGNEDGRSIGERLAVDPNKDSVLYFGSRDDGLWKSADYGATWSRVSGFPMDGIAPNIGIGFVLFDRASGVRGQASSTIYVGAANATASLYRSADGGATWAAVPGQPTGFWPHHGVIASDSSLYLTYGKGPGPNGVSDGAVWKLNLRSGAWTDVTPVKPGDPSGFGYAGLACDPQHAGTVMVSTLDRWNPGDDIFRSTDGGAHWAAIRSQARMDSSLSRWLNWGAAAPRFGWWLGALAIDPCAPGHVIYGTGATIWGSDDVTAADAGQPTHWSVRAAGLEETAVICLISPPEGAHLISGLGDIGGFRHDDLNASPAGMWTNPQTDNTDSLDYAEDRPETIVRAGRGNRGQNGGYSLDGGASWSAFKSEPTGSRGSGSIAISADGRTFVWAAAAASVACSRDRGATWTPAEGITGPRIAVISDRVRPNVFYARSADRLLVSEDGGATFAPAATLPAGASQLRAAPGAAGDLWLTAGSHGVYHSTDGGRHFVEVGDVADAQGLGFGKAAPGRTYPSLYLTGQTRDGESGVFRSDDTGQTWVRLNDAMHQYGWSGQVVTGDPRIYGRVYMGSNGRGILYGDPAVRNQAQAAGR